MPPELVPSGNLELAVEIPPAVGQRQEAAIRSGDGVKHQILDSVALLIGDPQLQVRDDLPVNFDVPGFALWILNSSRDDIGIWSRRNQLARGIESQDGAVREVREDWDV